MIMRGNEIPKSRHPHIIYWYWTDEVIKNEKYLRDIDTVAKDGIFTLMVMTARDGLDFWSPSIYPHFEKAVAYGREKGIGVVLQLFPSGFVSRIEEALPKNEMTAIVNDGECTVSGGKAYYHDVTRNARYPEFCPVDETELVKAYAFCKTADGVYDPSTLTDVTESATIVSCEPGSIDLEFNLPSRDGDTVYVLTAHYHRAGDLYGPYYPRVYCEIMDRYRDVPFAGVVLDEFKNLPALDFKKTLRERYYGYHFKAAFENKTGCDLDRTLFDMRYAPQGDTATRPAAINRYFNFLRRSTEGIENVVTDYSRQVFGENSFLGLHNTFHNSFENDEIYATGCNWWNLPRRYAQTDECMVFPVRMGMACRCPESLTYDMYYHWDASTFYTKAMHDAKFGGRIHYHAMNDYLYGVDVGSETFLSSIHEIEKKIDLLNEFDPVLPSMELLVVFCFASIYNWYPDETARTTFDLNGKNDVLERVNRLWNAGYYNALIPDDAIRNDEIVRNEDGSFSYGGHRFAKLLFLYPQYADKKTLDWLSDAASQQASVFLYGDLSADSDGQTVSRELYDSLAPAFLSIDADIPSALGLTPNSLLNGCYLEDGSAVFSDLSSLSDHQPLPVSIDLGGHRWEFNYEGVAAIQVNAQGKLVRFVSGNCRYLMRDGKAVFSSDSGEDVVIR